MGFENCHNLHIRIIHFFLQLIGIWVNSTNRKINHSRVLIFILALVPALIGQIIKLTTTLNDLRVGTEALLHASLIGHAVFVYLFILHEQPTINQMVCIVETNFNNLEGIVNQKTSFREKREKNSALFIIIFVVFGIVCIVGYLFLSKFYSFYLNYTEKGLLFPMSLPFQLNNKTYYVVFSYQLFTFLSESLIQATSIALFSVVINMLCAELEVLGKAFENMSMTVNMKVKECNDSVCSANTIKEHTDYHALCLLKLYIQHHALLIRFCSDIQKVFRWPLLELFVNCEIMLCLSSFQTFQVYGFTTIGQSITNVNLVVTITWHELIYFWFGEQLKERSVALLREVFSSGWYNYSLKFRRSLLIILERTKQPLVLYAVIFPVTLATFIKCLQAAVSYFNLLVALFK